MNSEAFRKRPCGECTFCCSAPAIEGTEPPLTAPKPAAKACEHCTNEGCRIYEARPKLCRDYLCLYATGNVEHRPDTVGVAWTIQPFMDIPDAWMLTGHAVDAEAAVLDPRNWKPIGDFIQRGASNVVIRDARIAYAFLPVGGKILNLQCEVDQTDPIKVRLLPEIERPSPYRLVLE